MAPLQGIDNYPILYTQNTVESAVYTVTTHNDQLLTYTYTLYIYTLYTQCMLRSQSLGIYLWHSDYTLGDRGKGPAARPLTHRLYSHIIYTYTLIAE
jgi:hypothetical protein